MVSIPRAFNSSVGRLDLPKLGGDVFVKQAEMSFAEFLLDFIGQIILNIFVILLILSI